MIAQQTFDVAVHIFLIFGYLTTISAAEDLIKSVTK